jgi:hypothetical protein
MSPRLTCLTTKVRRTSVARTKTDGWPLPRSAFDGSIVVSNGAGGDAEGLQQPSGRLRGGGEVLGHGEIRQFRDDQVVDVRAHEKFVSIRQTAPVA